MSEKLLDGLMHLFAILARGDGKVTEDEVHVVESFLRQQLNPRAAEKYLTVFQQYAKLEETEDLHKVAADAGRELTQKQKYAVVVQLMELIHADNKVSRREATATAIVADLYHVPKLEFQALEMFVFRKDPENLRIPNLLRIGEPMAGLEKEHLIIETAPFDGYISVLRAESVDGYLVKYSGKAELLMNGQPIVPGRVYFMPPGSVFRKQHHRPIYYSDIIACFLWCETRPNLSFEASELEYRFKGGKVGLHNINLREKSGALVGLMGASGSGKSTLLNVLNGNLTPSNGGVTINGIDVHRSGKALEGVIGYVSQDDLLVEELTVYQNLQFNAKLCFADLTEDQLHERVMKMLSSLGLAEIKDIPVGNPLNKKISGGQRKRLNIALELIREPAVLFVDEPTSGLSSRDSENIMDLLKELALRGKLVFVVIHQPSSDIYKMFDKLYILDVGGWPIYYGNPVEAVLYFKRQAELINSDYAECGECGNVNPEQIFNIIETKVLDEDGNFTDERKYSPQDWHQAFQKQVALPDVQRISTPPEKNLALPPRWRQFWVFTLRDVLSKLANHSYLVINFLEAPLLAIVLAGILRYASHDEASTAGYTLYDNINLPAYLFISILVALFMGLTVSAEEILRDRKIRKREAFLNLSRSAYLTSKVLVLFAISAIQTGTFVLIGNLIMGVPDIGLAHWMVLFSASCFANLMGLNISSTFDSAVTIYILVPILLIPQIILSGVIVKFEKLNPLLSSDGQVPLIGDVMASRWAYEGLAVKQFRDNAYEQNFYTDERTFSQAQYKLAFWLRKLEAKLALVETSHGKPGQERVVADALALMQAELRQEVARFKGQDFPVLDQLTPEQFNAEVAKQTKAVIQSLSDYYTERSRKAETSKNARIAELTQDSAATAEFLALKMQHHNKAVQDLVTNRDDEVKILESGNRLIQNSDPVYNDVPLAGRQWLDYRAHFFAPRKPFLGQLWDTFAFNLLVIWFMTTVLCVTLYYESFRRGIERVGQLFSKAG